MKLKKTITTTGVVFFIISLLLFTGFIFSQPEVSRCIFINYSSRFEESGENIYISKDTPPAVKDSVLSLISLADKRVKSFWNENKRTGNPVIIYCHNNNLFKKYSARKFIITYKTPVNCYIVFGKNCIDKDMISHELAHSEFASKLNFFKRTTTIPVWFDEGLALRVDLRNDFSVQKYIEVRDSINREVKLSDIETFEDFMSGDSYYHYLYAGYEVNNWLKSAGLKGLINLVDRINAGEEFLSAYKAEEN